MRRILFSLLALAIMVMTAQESWAQSPLGNIPKKVDYRDARITDVGAVADTI